jgi:hypothetical protein
LPTLVSALKLVYCLVVIIVIQPGHVLYILYHLYLHANFILCCRDMYKLLYLRNFSTKMLICYLHHSHKFFDMICKITFCINHCMYANLKDCWLYKHEYYSNTLTDKYNKKSNEHIYFTLSVCLALLREIYTYNMSANANIFEMNNETIYHYCVTIRYLHK